MHDSSWFDGRPLRMRLSVVLLLAGFTGCSSQTAAPPAAGGGKANPPAAGPGTAVPPAAATPAPATPLAGNPVPPEQILQQVADFYKKQPTLAVTSDFTMNVTTQGVDNRMADQLTVTFERPNRLALRSQGGMLAFEIVSNGEKLYISLPATQSYSEAPAPKNITELAANPLMAGLASGGGMFILGLIADDPYHHLMDGVSSSSYAGRERIESVEVHHVKFQQNQFDWEIWVDAGAQPLVHQISMDMSKSMNQLGAAFGQAGNMKLTMVHRFSNWSFPEQAPADSFVFTPPAGAQKTNDLFGSLSGGGQMQPSPLLGAAAPPVELDQLEGGQFQLEKLAGKQIVMLDFWATWCGPCVKELPILTEVAEQYKDKGVAFYAVNQGEKPEVIREFLEQSKLKFNVLLDPESEIGIRYGVQGIPMLVLIDKAGVVQSVHIGYQPDIKEKLTKELDELLSGKSLVEAKAPDDTK